MVTGIPGGLPQLTASFTTSDQGLISADSVLQSFGFPGTKMLGLSRSLTLLGSKQTQDVSDNPGNNWRCKQTPTPGIPRVRLLSNVWFI